MSQESTKMFDSDFKKSVKGGLRTGAQVAAFLAPILIIMTTLSIVQNALTGGSSSSKR